MLNDQHRIAGIHKPVENLDEPVNVRGVEPCSRLVQDIDGPARGCPAQLRSQLHPLGLAAGEGGAGLAQLDIAQAHLAEHLGLPADLWQVLKELHSFFTGHIQHLGDVLALVLDLQGLPVVSGSMADLTGHIHIRQEVHLDFYQAVTGAGLAPAPLHIEAEPARTVAPHFGIRRRSEKIPDVVEEPGVGSRVGPGGPANGALVDVDDLVQIFQPLHASAGAGAAPGMVQLCQQGLIQHLVDQAGLAGAGDTGDAGKGSQGYGHIHVLQVVFPGPPDGQELPVPRPPVLRHRDLLFAGEILPRDGIRAVQNVLQGPRGNDPAAVASRPGAHIHNIVRGAHGVLVVLHHDQGIAQVPQVLQSRQKLIVVPLVQANGGLVQNIQHPHKGGANLGRKSDPLAFAAGEGPGPPGQGQIAQAHIRQEPEPGGDLPDDLLGHHRHVALQAEIFHKLQLLDHAHAAELHNIQPAYGDSQSQLVEPVPVALGAGGRGHALLQLLPGGVGLGLPVAAGDIVENALKGLLQHPHAVAPVIGHPQLFRAGAVEDHLHGILGQALYRLRQGEVILLGQGLKVHPENGIRPGTLPAGGLNGPLENGLVLIRDHQILVGNELKAQAGAAGAGPVGIVEGEHSGLQLRQANAAVLAGIVLGEAQLLVFLRQLNDHQAAGMGTGRLDGVRQAAAKALFQHQPVHHQLDGVLFVLLQLDLFRQIIEDAVHPDPGKALLPGILKDLDMLALLPPNDRRQHHKPGALSQGLYPVHNLVDGLFFDLLAALGAVGRSHPGPQQPQIVVDLRHRTHGGPGALGGGLLVNGNGRGQPVDGVHIRLVHLPQKLPGIGTQALHIPPLALGIDGIKGQAGFSGAAEAGKHHHFVPGDGNIHIFQIVFPGTPDDDSVVHSLTSLGVVSFFVPSIIPQARKCYK